MHEEEYVRLLFFFDLISLQAGQDELSFGTDCNTNTQAQCIPARRPFSGYSPVEFEAWDVVKTLNEPGGILLVPAQDLQAR